MNEKNNNNFASEEVTIRDLKNLGKQGGATALLMDGKFVRLVEGFGLIRRMGIVNSEQIEVEVVESYLLLYPKIRTIKRDNIIIARRVKVGKETKLILTGQGYKRPKY